MKEYKTTVSKTYVVNPQTTCTVTTADGTIIATCPAHQQTAFVAPKTQVFVSDDAALVTETFKCASLPAPEGGEYQPLLPEGTLRWSLIQKHFTINAQPGAQGIPAAENAPSAVYISRVPWARWEGDADTGQWVNNASEVNEDVFGVARKLMDNAGLQHQCSTDTVEGVDDYNGIRWPFYWQHANYITDEHGVKHLTAIKGEHETFNPYTQNTAAFGPAFWFFCCLERSQAADGTWRTHDGTESGTPLFQLWGISARPWDELDEGRREELTALGVSQSDLHLWPECQVWDARKEQLVPRPYWCHAAYYGGAEPDGAGNTTLVSKTGVPPIKDLSQESLNELLGSHPGTGAAACVNGFGMLVDIVKNATKNSQSIHKGLCCSLSSAVLATLNTAQADYIFPISEAGPFRTGSTVCLWRCPCTVQHVPAQRSLSSRFGRIAAIENRTLTLADGSSADSLCLVFDPATVEPFLVRTDAEAAAELTRQGIFACCYATFTLPLSGETDSVPYPHDGSRESFTDGCHPYRVLGTEYSIGAWELAGDTVAIKGEENMLLLQAPPDTPRCAQGAADDFSSQGYEVIGTCPLAPASGAYVLNEVLTHTGVAHPAAAGGNGSGSAFGHADMLFTSASTGAFATGGRMPSEATPSYDGSAALSLDISCTISKWYFTARA